MNKETCFCPLLNKNIIGYECFDVSMYAEGQGPASTLPDGVDEKYVEDHAETCLKCKYHPT